MVDLHSTATQQHTTGVGADSTIQLSRYPLGLPRGKAAAFKSTPKFRLGLRQDKVQPCTHTSLHRLRALSVRPAQPRFRQISNRQRIRRPADCVTYTISLLSARPSSLRLLMYACRKRTLKKRHVVVSQQPHTNHTLWSASQQASKQAEARQVEQGHGAGDAGTTRVCVSATEQARLLLHTHLHEHVDLG